MHREKSLPEKQKVKGIHLFRGHRLHLGYAVSGLLVVLAVLLSILLHWLKPANMVMLYLAAVVCAGLFLGRGPAMLASLLSVLAFDFLQVDPRLSLTVADPEDLITFSGLLLVGVVVSTSAARLQDQVKILRTRQAHLAALNSLSGDLARAVNLKEMLDLVVSHVERVFNHPASVWLPAGADLHLAKASEGLKLSARDHEAAQAAHQGTLRTGFGTSVCPDADVFCLHLETSTAGAGVLGVVDCHVQGALSDEQRSLLEGFANLSALAFERARLAEQASQAEVLENTERLQTALLHSISHELRTPLVSITGALSTLADRQSDAPTTEEDRAAHRELIDTAYEEAQRLNLLVGNLLDISRLEAGAFRLSLEPCDLQDLVGIALGRFAERHSQNLVRVKLADGLPLAKIDVALMVQVLLNLLDNAAKYSPPEASVDIDGRLQGDELVLSVTDTGAGIPEEDLMKVFGKFYRSTHATRIGGIGLGLSICKGIVEAHGGRIWAERRQPQGTRISLTLPMEGVQERAGMDD